MSRLSRSPREIILKSKAAAQEVVMIMRCNESPVLRGVMGDCGLRILMSVIKEPSVWLGEWDSAHCDGHRIYSRDVLKTAGWRWTCSDAMACIDLSKWKEQCFYYVSFLLLFNLWEIKHKPSICAVAYTACVLRPPSSYTWHQGSASPDLPRMTCVIGLVFSSCGCELI